MPPSVEEIAARIDKVDGDGRAADMRLLDTIMAMRERMGIEGAKIESALKLIGDRCDAVEMRLVGRKGGLNGDGGLIDEQRHMRHQMAALEKQVVVNTQKINDQLVALSSAEVEARKMRSTVEVKRWHAVVVIAGILGTYIMPIAMRHEPDREALKEIIREVRAEPAPKPGASPRVDGTG